MRQRLPSRGPWVRMCHSPGCRRLRDRERRKLTALANARIAYYRQLQRLSDNVTMLQLAPEAVPAELPDALRDIDESLQPIAAMAGRVRYLDQLAAGVWAGPAVPVCTPLHFEFRERALTPVGARRCLRGAGATSRQVARRRHRCAASARMSACDPAS